MKDFLYNNYSLLTHFVEATAALTGLLLFNKYKNTSVKYFIYFLVYLTIFDFLTRYTRFVYPARFLEFLIDTVFQKNHWLATSFWKIGAIMFFAFYYQKILISKVFKNIIKYASYGFFIISVIYIIIHFEEFFYKFFPIISIMGAVIVFLCSVLYFLEILQSDKILTFYKSINFYISAAIFIWWLIITPIVFYDVYYVYEIGNPDRDWDYRYLRRLIYISANIIMYSTFTFALIWCKPEND